MPLHETLSFRYDVSTNNERSWASNAVRFATKQEAEGAAKELFARWMSVTHTRVVADEAPVNYTFKDGRLASLSAVVASALAGA